MLSKLLPTATELEIVETVCAGMRSDKRQREQFNKDLYAFLQRQGVKRWRPSVMSHYWSKERDLSFEQKTLVFDFLITDHLTQLTAEPERFGPANITTLTKAKLDYSATRPASNEKPPMPLSFFFEQDEARPTRTSAAPFLGAYVGYRVSSIQGQVVRFSLSIEQSDNHEISFKNIYDRDKVRWLCEGGGLLHENSLYLIGKAVNERNRLKHRGYRMLCLETWRDSRILHGVVISRDNLGPIAARFVAIPVDLHDFDVVEGRYAQLFARHCSAASDGGWDLANALIETDRDFLDGIDPGAYAQLEQAIEKQTLNAISEWEGPKEQLYIWNFIMNVTGTTLHGYLKRPDVDTYGEAPGMDAPFDAMFDRLILRKQRSRASMRDMVYAQLQLLVADDTPG